MPATASLSSGTKEVMEEGSTPEDLGAAIEVLRIRMRKAESKDGDDSEIEEMAADLMKLERVREIRRAKRRLQDLEDGTEEIHTFF